MPLTTTTEFYRIFCLLSPPVFTTFLRRFVLRIEHRSFNARVSCIYANFATAPGAVCRNLFHFAIAIKEPRCGARFCDLIAFYLFIPNDIKTLLRATGRSRQDRHSLSLSDFLLSFLVAHLDGKQRLRKQSVIFFITLFSRYAR